MPDNHNLESGPATPHPDYAAHIDKWQKVRLCHDGEDAVKAECKTHLPRPSGMDRNREYRTYVTRASFLPAVDHTEEVWSGMLFHEPPEIDGPGEVLELTDDITLTGQPLAGFAQDVVEEALVAGRFALLMDFAAAPGEPIRPYWTLRTAEQLINWRTAQATDGREILTRAVFREDALVDGDEEYSLVYEPRIREYLLTDEGVKILTHAFREETWTLIDEAAPMLYEQPLDEIPVLIANWRQLGVKIIKPPLLSIANLVLSHFRSSADIEQGNYYASLPTAFVTGAKLPAAALPAQTHEYGDTYAAPAGGYRMGSGKVWELPKDAKAGYLEIAGPGLDSIHKTMDKKEKHLVAVGARLTAERQGRYQETAEAVRNRMQAEVALLRLVANVTDQILTLALQTVGRWLLKKDVDATVKLNREGLDPIEEEPKPSNPYNIEDWPE